MPAHGQRHKRSSPPWRRPVPKKRRRIVFTEEERVSPFAPEAEAMLGVLARHIEEANARLVMSGRIGTAIDVKMERMEAE